ncbi:MAG: hypothetical protein ACYS4T_14475 [Planctomycetota bacterium]|jgi:phosphodiesterase/alkaline phosphatase D-like protein
MNRKIYLIAALNFIPLILLTNIEAAQENHITHGPILGRLSAQGIGIWARTAKTGSFAVHYGLNPGKLTQMTKPVKTLLDHDNTGWIHITGLKADTKYYYELVIPEIDQQTGRGGSFRTLPDPGELVDPELNPKGLFNFSFEFACGNNQNPEHSIGPSYPAFKTMLSKLKNKIHFAIQNGDWLYGQRTCRMLLKLLQLLLAFGRIISTS